jgi:crotonobetainyl-CoA:carnitine CoA-transferase CaiB-like acyl-CoA transferase
VFADPQVEHLQLTRRVTHPVRGEVDVLRPPLTFSDTPATVRSGVPGDGEHTRAVLAELGYADDEIDDLHASGVVGITTNETQETP